MEKLRWTSTEPQGMRGKVKTDVNDSDEDDEDNNNEEDNIMMVRSCQHLSILYSLPNILLTTTLRGDTVLILFYRWGK